jgi:hypothetical protein
MKTKLLIEVDEQKWGVPQAELESATFCSASKRSIQLRYWGIRSGLNIPPSGRIVKQWLPAGR